MSELINPAAFPAKSADLDTGRITASAADVRSMGRTVEDRTRSISARWAGLGAHYEAPEQHQVYALMDPAVTSADELNTAFAAMARHLDTFAAALDAIKPRLRDLERRAAAFRADVVDGVEVDASEAKDAGVGDHLAWAFDWVPGVDEKKVTVPWYEDGDTVARNNDLVGEYHQILEDISAANKQCADDINALVENACVAPVQLVTAEALDHAEQPLPWGSARDEDRNCPESVGHGVSTFGGDLWDGTRQMVVGYNPETGGYFEGSAYGQAWGGLGDLVGSTLLLASPVGWVAAGMAATGNNDNGFSRFMEDRSQTVVGGWGSLIGYDAAAEDGWHRWREDGVAAGTGAFLSIGTFFIPGAGQVGAGLRAGSVGARVARIAAAGADFAVQGGSWAVRGGLRVTAGLRGALRFGDDALPSPGQAARGADGVRIAPTALIGAMDDVPASTAATSTPVSDSLGLAPSRTETPTTTARPGPEGPAGPSALYDPAAPVRPTVDGSQAPTRPTPADVEAARDNAPVNGEGRPVDHRNGAPLRPETVDGSRGWHMKWDPETGQWVAENPGSATTRPGDLPPTGEPGSFGYDAAGDRLPYANHRPSYAPGQELEVWENAPRDADGNVRVLGPGRTSVVVEWEPGTPREGVWDMGHVPDAQYRHLRDQYLRHEIDLDEFLELYRDPANYQVEHPSVNRGRTNEVP